MAAGALTRWMHRTHRSVGSVLSLLIALWFASGAVMTFAGYPRFTDAERLALAPALPYDAEIVLPEPLQRRLAARPDGARVRLAMHEGEPTWLYDDMNASRMALRAEAGLAFSTLDEARIRQEATGRFKLPVQTVEQMTESDQWTVAIAKPGNMPLYRVSFADASDTQVYISARTGETLQMSTRSERLLAWLGAIPHWIYPTILRRERDLWRYTVLALSAIGLLVTISGTLAGLHVWRATRNRKAPRDPYLRWHQWLGLWFGLFASTWLLSGALSLTPFQWTGERAPSARERTALYGVQAIPSATSLQRALSLCQRALTVRELELSSMAGHSYAICTDSAHRTRLVDLATAHAALTAIPAPMLAELAERLAGPVAHAASLESAYDSYYYPTHGGPDTALPYFRVALQDEEGTTYYVDPSRARLVRKHTARTRLERWLYHGLHSFDLPGLYEQRTLWRSLIVGAMVLGFALSGLGFWMSVRRARRAAARKQRRASSGENAPRVQVREHEPML